MVAFLILVSFIVLILDSGTARLSAGDELDLAASSARHLLTISLVAGVGSMALVEVAKNLLRLRGFYHYRTLSRELGDVQEWIPWDWSLRPITYLDLPLEQLIAQLSTQAEAELDAEQYGLRPEGGRLTEIDTPRGRRRARDKLMVGREPDTSLVDRLLFPVESVYEMELLVAQPAMTRQRLEQRLDDLLLLIGNDWRYRLRLSATLVAGCIGLLAVSFESTSVATKLAVVITSAIWGGLIAWLARDLSAAIERWGRR